MKGLRTPLTGLLGVLDFAAGFTLLLIASDVRPLRWNDAADLTLLVLAILRFLLLPFLSLAAHRAWAAGLATALCLASLGSGIAFLVLTAADDSKDTVACYAIWTAFPPLELLLLISWDRAVLVQREERKASGVDDDAEGLAAPLLEPEGEGVGGAGETAGDEPPKAHASFARLMCTARPEYPLLAWGCFALLFSTLSTMAFPYYLGKIIDAADDEDASRDTRMRRLAEGALELLVITLVGNVFTFFRGAAFSLAGERVVARMRRGLYRAILAQETAFFDTQETGELMNRLSADTTVIQSACTVNISMGLRFVAQAVLSVLLLFITSWKLSLVMISVVPALVVGTVFFGAYIKKISKQYQDALAASAAVSQEALSSLRTVRSFGAEKKEQKRYDSRVDETYRLGAKKAIAYGVFSGATSAASYAAIVCVLWYGGVQVVNGDLSAGELTSFLVYTLYVAFSMGAMSGLFTEFMNAVGASERVFQLIDREPAIHNNEGLEPPFPPSGHISFRDVSFAYPSRPDAVVLSDFSLSVQPRETVALVGQSGSGKSTVLALLQRLYDPKIGSVALGDHDLRDLDSRYLKRHIGVVSQEPSLFSGTIRENILYGRRAAEVAVDQDALEEIMPWDRRGRRGSQLPEEAPLVSEERLREVARMANCLEFIDDFPDGFETVTGERGVRLSGGQKQRIAIARALLCDPKVLVLDEATSALDAESEFLVQQAIERIMEQRTVVLVAHRLSTVISANRILVMQHGKIMGVGSHEELLATNEIYQALVKRQLQGSAAEVDNLEAPPGKRERAGAAAAGVLTALKGLAWAPSGSADDRGEGDEDGSV